MFDVFWLSEAAFSLGNGNQVIQIKSVGDYRGDVVDGGSSISEASGSAVWQIFLQPWVLPQFLNLGRPAHLPVSTSISMQARVGRNLLHTGRSSPEASSPSHPVLLNSFF